MKKKGFFAVMKTTVVRTKLWLLVATMLFTGLTGAWAQTVWTAPTVPGIDLDSYDGSTAVTVYNVEANAVLSNGMSWGTNAVAARLEGGTTGTLVDRQKCTLVVSAGTVKMVHAKHTAKGVGCASTNANDLYCDYGSNFTWTYAKSSNYDGAYTLTQAGFGTLDVASKWGGKLTIKDGYGNTDWAFIPQASLTDGSLAKFIERKAMWEVYQAVVDKSLFATALNTAYTTYSNASATASELRAATRTLIKAVVAGTDRSKELGK